MGTGGTRGREGLADWEKTEGSMNQRSLYERKKSQVGGGLREQVGQEIAFTMEYWRDKLFEVSDSGPH